MLRQGRGRFNVNGRTVLSVLLLMAILAQSLFALMRGHFMALTLFSAGHCLLRYCMIFAVNRIS